MKYKCLETFGVPELDDLEMNEEGREFIVYEGSIWKSDKPITKNEQEVFLSSDGSTLNIAKELFDLMFEEVKA
ncbi:hypothetical protein PMU66_02695 [Enterococcus durans]|uniref:Uncharacterized protein n=1 Tax=Enterococcus durans TaxID=53345 RepID=A0A367CEI7_9ENTE|nr:hypothetical protein [Enterococcus durans]MBE8847898.1 hypothetical protein [Enterococcus durans]MDB1652583.1 hypothetical protein [Enterococcus durans]MDB1656175.1 hypothetical protein [Enterococcus durans]MDB1663009.1 hypothetical protein [Enterococcus durans]MDB1668153.1 hypothetical protein [Enterococcus durans]